MSPPQLRKVRKGTRSCWECTSRTITSLLRLPLSLLRLHRSPAVRVSNYKRVFSYIGKRRKIRCSFQPGNPATCIWCISHNLVCISQRFRDEASDASRNQSMEERMMRMENLLGRVLQQMEAASTHPPHPAKESPRRPETAEDGTGIDVVNTDSTISNPSSTSAVVSIFKSSSVRIKAHVNPVLGTYYILTDPPIVHVRDWRRGLFNAYFAHSTRYQPIHHPQRYNHVA